MPTLGKRRCQFHEMQCYRSYPRQNGQFGLIVAKCRKMWIYVQFGAMKILQAYFR